mmetsp:Transcript_14012/g.55491  ORF Transcript_14012/g.55491 Transcript_14012/m.55491 type:complete len:335 (+) Transcript_14012:610-1614(+)
MFDSQHSQSKQAVEYFDPLQKLGDDREHSPRRVDAAQEVVVAVVIPAVGHHGPQRRVWVIRVVWAVWTVFPARTYVPARLGPVPEARVLAPDLLCRRLHLRRGYDRVDVAGDHQDVQPGVPNRVDVVHVMVVACVDVRADTDVGRLHRRGGVSAHLRLDDVGDGGFAGRVAGVAPAAEPTPPPRVSLPRRGYGALASRHGLLARRQAPGGEQRGHLEHQSEGHVAEALEQELVDEGGFRGSGVRGVEAHGALPPELVARAVLLSAAVVLVVVIVDRVIVLLPVLRGVRVVHGRSPEHGLNRHSLADGERADGQLRRRRPELRDTPVEIFRHHAR